MMVSCARLPQGSASGCMAETSCGVSFSPNLTSALLQDADDMAFWDDAPEDDDLLLAMG